MAGNTGEEEGPAGRFFLASGQPNVAAIIDALDNGEQLPDEIRGNYELADEISTHLPSTADVLATEVLIDRRTAALQQLGAELRARGWEGHASSEVPPIAAIILGTTAAGKSSLLARPLASYLPGWLADADMVKPWLLPEYRQGYGNQAVHAESTEIRKAFVARVAERGESFVYQTIGEDPADIGTLIEAFRDIDYRVWLYVVHISEDQAVERCRGRFLAGGQGYIPPSITRGYGELPLATYNLLKGRADGFARIDNGDEPTLVEVDRAWVPEPLRPAA